MSEIAQLERQCNRFAKDLDRLQGLKELGVEGAKGDYTLTLHAYLDTKKEIEKMKGTTKCQCICGCKNEVEDPMQSCCNYCNGGWCEGQ